jgi:hypothetical protein
MKLKILIIALLFALAVGCKTQKQVVEVPIQYKEKVITRLVKVKTNDDSIRMKAMFECDSLNQVVLKSISEHKTPGISSQTNFQGGILDYHAFVVHDTVRVEAKDSVIYKEVPVKVPVQVNELTNWQIVQIYAGRLFLASILIYLLIRLLKKRLNLN